MALEAPITKKRRLTSGADILNSKGEIIGKDKEKRSQSVCVGCGSQINDQYIMQVSPDLCWHASCLKCADCEQYLDESCTCFVRDGKTYCKRDYVRLFGTKCSRCGLGFCREDVVMRPTKGTVYHLNCFRCIVCNKPLVTGDEFAIREDSLFCRADHDVIDRSVTASPCQDIGSPESAYGGGNNNSVTCSNNNSNNSSHQHSNNNNNNTPGSGGKDPDIKKSGRGDKSTRGTHKSDHKTTRVRTVLNEKQLHTLRTCYNANPRPDALMKEQLTEMTGLSPRVIRVWFQNKRCKDKKRSILMKQIQQQQEKNGGLSRPLQGVPMVASSPVRHEPPVGMQGNPVEVQSYQTPWKALSEFAMQGDLDQPHAPFQQLVSNMNIMNNNNNNNTTINSNNTFLQHQQHIFHHLADNNSFNDDRAFFVCYSQQDQINEHHHLKHQHHHHHHLRRRHGLLESMEDDDDVSSKMMLFDDEDDTVVYLEDH